MAAPNNAAPNNAAMPGLLNTVSNNVVAIHVEPVHVDPAAKLPKTLVFSGTVLLCRQDLIYMITVSEIRDHIDNATIKLKTDNDFITLDRNNFHLDGAKSLVVIHVANPPPGAFQHLEQVDFNEQGIQHQQKIYTYSISKRPGVRMITPGSIILTDNGEGTFDHNSAGYKFTHLGAPVLNELRQLVGICYTYSGGECAGCYSAYDAQSIADEIDGSFGRNFTTIAATLHNLRQ